MEFIPTIEDDEDVNEESENDSEEEVAKGKNKSRNVFAAGFKFTEGNDKRFQWEINEAIEMATSAQSVEQTSLDAKIARAREIRRLKKERKKDKARERDLEPTVKEDSSECAEDDENEESGSDSDVSIDSLEDMDCSSPTPKGHKEKFASRLSDENAEYFSHAPPMSDNIAFTDMNLSRPLLKAVTSIGYSVPTPVQARTIPLALMGKDICACAATGTGKTAAFILPILERLLFRPTHGRVIRVLIITPTRELAIQIHSVGKALAKHTNIELCLAAGGLDSRAQEAALRKSPDIVVATPGRLVDHLHNTPSFSLQTIEILVLDEADRMLDEHFLDQMNEIIRLCPKNRQTLLFSATMTDEIEELARLSLNHPVRLFVDSNMDTADNLHQEFVRIRSNREGDREAITTALCCRTFKDQCLLFLPTKRLAHRLRILFGLLGLKAAELHGSLSQLQRLESLKQFKEGSADVLLATDLAARGLDIEGVKTVINYSMPPALKQYIHRVGRTARAGRSGRSVTLVGEKGRKVLKDVVKQAKYPVKSRVVPYEVVMRYKDKIRNLEKELKQIMKQEEEEKQIRITEMEVNKAKNMIEHRDEIYSRPPRVWFQEKRTGQKRQRGCDDKIKKTETEEEVKMRRENEYATRVAKRANKQKKLNTVALDANKKGKSSHRKLNPVIKAFDSDMTQQSTKKHKPAKYGSRPQNSASKGHKFKSKKKFKRR